jgi:hypothetical protein
MKKLFLFFVLLLTITAQVKAQYFHTRYYLSPITAHEWLNCGLKTKLNNPSDFWVAAGRQNLSPNSRVRYLTTNSSGTPIANITYDIPVGNTGSPLTRAEGNSIAEYTGGYIIAGSAADNTSSGATVPGGSDILLLKINQAGTVVASKRIDLGGRRDIAMCIKRSNTTNIYYVSGYSVRTNNASDAFLMKIDVNLNVVWVTSLDVYATTVQTRESRGNSIAEDASGNIWVAGTSRLITGAPTDGLVFGTNSAGALLNIYIYDWSGSNDGFNSIKRTQAGDYVVCGYADPFGTVTRDILVAKLVLPAGTVTWSNTYRATNSNARGYDIAERINPTTGAAEYYAAGQDFSGTFGSDDAIVYKISNAGAALSHFEFGATGIQYARSIDIVNLNQAGDGFAIFGSVVDPSTTFLTSGIWKAYFNGVTACDDSMPSPLYSGYSLTKTIPLTSNSLTLTQFTVLPVALTETHLNICFANTVAGGSNARMSITGSDADDLIAYPNPVGDAASLALDLASSAEGIADLRLVDHLGRIITEESINVQEGNNMLQLDMVSLPKGIYLLQVNVNGRSYVKKIIK